MTSFHACYSFGALAGGLIGGLFAWAQIRPSVNFAIVAAPCRAWHSASAGGCCPTTNLLSALSGLLRAMRGRRR
jgi:hypothetical protein